MNGVPALWAPSARSGTLPVMALTMASQATKTTLGSSQVTSARRGLAGSRPRTTATTRTMKMAATATMTVSLHNAP